MIEIDKRKFLTELGKLLTLMYEEDSRTAIGMYEQMFRECTDESALISFLGSPTKQAVMLARCYNSKEKNLGVKSEHGAGDAAVASGRTPAFVQAILNLREDAVSAGLIYAVGPVYFQADDNIGKEEILLDEEDEEDEEGPSPAEDPPPCVAIPADPPVPSANDFDISTLTSSRKDPAPLFEDTPDFTTAVVDSFGRFTLDLGPAEGANAVAVGMEEDADEEEDFDEEVSTYTVDEDQLVLDGFDTVARTAGAAALGDAFSFSPAASNGSPSKKEKKLPQDRKSSAAKAAGVSVREYSEASAPKTVTINIAIMILYLLIAIPLVAAGVLLLLMPALLFLAFAAVTGIAAFNVIATAFGSFAVFADILVVLGAGLLLSALAFLFLLIFAWFIGCAIAGIINGAIRLGGRICCREVQ